MSTKKNQAKKPAKTTSAVKRERELSAEELAAKRTEEGPQGRRGGGQRNGHARQGAARSLGRKARQGAKGQGRT